MKLHTQYKKLIKFADKLNKKLSCKNNPMNDLHTRISECYYKYGMKNTDCPTCLFLGPKEKKKLEGEVKKLGYSDVNIRHFLASEKKQYMGLNIYYISENGIRCGITIGE